MYKTHGLKYITGKIRPEYYIWTSIKARCNNPNNHNYKHYGKRGIKMSKEWETSFQLFYNDMGQRPSNLYSIGRIDNDKGYSKDNCRWETIIEQSNNRRSNIKYSYNGKSLTLAEWAREVNMRMDVLWYRIKNGWDVNKALNTPSKNQNSNNVDIIRVLELYNKGESVNSIARQFNVTPKVIKKKLIQMGIAIDITTVK